MDGEQVHPHRLTRRRERGDAVGPAEIQALRSGDQAIFASVAQLFRRELHLHCYRMLGSYEDAEELVQETFLRAWRARGAFEGRASLRNWLYRIATNACVDALRGRSRRVRPADVSPAADPGRAPAEAIEVPWLQPYPDRVLDLAAPDHEQPETAMLAKESVELTFLAAIQLLPPRQRAALILRDVLGWSAKETAATLGISVIAANSALQRARETLRARLPASRSEWMPPSAPRAEERALVARYMEAHERNDASAVAELLSEDCNLTMPPSPSWYEGRAAILAFLERELSGPAAPEVRCIATGANGRPAVAFYFRWPGEGELAAAIIDVLTIRAGAVAEISGFGFPQLFPAFGLPPRL